jgi:2,4-dienoyl-CoA reductase (NADPH2)
MAATLLAERGHHVALFEAGDDIGGQLRLAAHVPGKEEFFELLRYFRQRVLHTGVQLQLGTRADVATLQGFDEVIVATGVSPRNPQIPGQDHAKVLSYIDVLQGRKPVGHKVAVIGAGGIGFDVAEYLMQDGPSTTLDIAAWQAEWGVTDPALARGGLVPQGQAPHAAHPARTTHREVILLQRKAGKLGASLGKTTGWIHRSTLKMKHVEMIGGVNYERIGDEGLLISHGEARRDPHWIACDNVVLCAGQVPQRELADALAATPAWQGRTVHVIGGAFEAGELDAKKAIDQAARLAAQL